jgi:hypothetical protein
MLARLHQTLASWPSYFSSLSFSFFERGIQKELKSPAVSAAYGQELKCICVYKGVSPGTGDLRLCVMVSYLAN